MEISLTRDSTEGRLKAFNRTMKDPEFIAEIEKRKYELDPTPGEELQALVQDVMAQPPEIIERMKKLLGN